MSSIFISKTVVFVLAIVITLITLRPMNIGMAAIFAIFVSQSNDFALGLPIVNAVYHDSHPEYADYIYLLAPISLCILNPIAFILLELNEKINKKSKKSEASHDTDEEANEEAQLIHEQSDEIETNHSSVSRRTNATGSSLYVNRITQDNDEIQNEDDSNQTEDQNDNSLEITKSERIKTRKLVKSIIWSTVSNPIVFMVIGI